MRKNARKTARKTAAAAMALLMLGTPAWADGFGVYEWSEIGRAHV